MRKTHFILTGILLVSIIAPGLIAAQKSEDESERLIKAASFLEQKPFDKEAKDIRRLALEWVIKTDRLSVNICSLLLSGLGDKYKYNSEVFAQYTLGMAAFKLTNHEKASDEAAAQLAGVESAMNLYEAMVKEKPKAKTAFMDDLLGKRASGTLAPFVEANNCKEKKTTP